jgi:spermidine synthase
VFRYAYFYLSAGHFKPDFQDALMLGGAAYTFPMFYLEQFPEATMDVVEIDPMLTELAMEHFNLRNEPRLKIFHEDGRIFLNNTDKKYDIFYGDAYNSLYTIPWHLTTVETVEKIYDVLNDDGVAMVNVISSISGPGSHFIRAELATFREVFPQVYAFALHDAEDDTRLQSIILLALKSEVPPSFESDHPSYGLFLGDEVSDKIVTDLPVLTDQYAPVEYYTNKAL